jgi:hypothetical protein
MTSCRQIEDALKSMAPTTKRGRSNPDDADLWMRRNTIQPDFSTWQSLQDLTSKKSVQMPRRLSPFSPNETFGRFVEADCPDVTSPLCGSPARDEDNHSTTRVAAVKATITIRNTGSREWRFASLHHPNAGELPQLLARNEQNRNLCVARINIVGGMYVR